MRIFFCERLDADNGRYWRFWNSIMRLLMMEKIKDKGVREEAL